jgi:hypothetical protein
VGERVLRGLVQTAHVFLRTLFVIQRTTEKKKKRTYVFYVSCCAVLDLVSQSAAMLRSCFTSTILSTTTNYPSN